MPVPPPIHEVNRKAVRLLLALISPVFFLVRPAAAENPAFRTDQILVMPKAGPNFTSALEKFQAARSDKALKKFPGIRGLQVVQVPPGQSAANLIAQYQRSGLVEFAEPDYLGHTFSTSPNDPRFSDGTLWALRTNSAPAAWDVLTSASNIVVAVLDTGVRYTHEDLAANMWTNPVNGSRGWNAIAGNNSPYDDGSANIGSAVGHGTLVSGVLGAVGNNGKGVCGVAWKLQLMACQCFTNGSGLGTISDCITCLNFARTNGARIINASWGFVSNSLALSNAIVSLQASNIIVVAAAGNNSTNLDVSPNYPIGYRLNNVVAVTATSTTDALSAYSNFGANSVDLGAPGDQIYSTWVPIDSFYLSGSSGTSFAAPYVAGACALLMAQYPADNYHDTIARLLGATDPLPSLVGKCRTGGRLNLNKILRTIRVATVGTNGAPFTLRVSGGLNRTNVVEATTNFSAWTPVFTNSSSTNGTFDFTDSPGLPLRFYRATANP